MPMQFASFSAVSIIFLLFLVAEIWAGCVLSTQKQKKGVSVRRGVTLDSLHRNSSNSSRASSVPKRGTLAALFRQQSNASQRTNRTHSQQSWPIGIASQHTNRTNQMNLGNPLHIGVFQQPYADFFGATLQGNPGCPRRQHLQKQRKQTEKWLNQPNLPYYSSDRSKKNSAKTKRQRGSTSNRKTNDKTNRIVV